GSQQASQRHSARWHLVDYAQAVSIQTHALRPRISEIEQHPERQLPLDVQVPRLRIPQPAAIGIPGETAALDIGLRWIRRRVFVHAGITLIPVERRLKIIAVIHYVRNAPP